MKRIACLLIVLAAFFTTVPANAVAKSKKDSAKKEEKADTVKKSNPYQDLMKENPEVHKGFITVYKSKGKAYFEMPLDILGREMLIGSTITETSDNGDGVIGSKPATPLHVTFSVTGEKVNLISVSKDYITDSDRDEFKAVLDKNTAGAIIQNFKVHSYNPDSTAVVFDVTDYFVGDNKSMRPFDEFCQNTFYGRAKRTPEFKSQNSFLVDVKAFDTNVSIKSSLSYKYSISVKGRNIFEDVPFTAVVTRSIILLDEKPYKRRPVDSRIAIFPTGKILFSEKEQSSKVKYFANRWRLEPSDTAAYRAGKLVDPVKPIVFYIDPAFPTQWQSAIYEAVDKWQKPFEEIGFSNAIMAKPYPENDPEFDPDNLKYSCIRYAPLTFENAMGPSWVDPRTGEIINASVYVYHDAVKLVNNWKFIQTSQADTSVRSGKLPEKVLHDALCYVIRHEVGHCLGLMHNMSSSAMIPVDSLRSPSFTQKYGTTYSIMDYARFNYVAQPGDLEKGVRLDPPEFGLYDYFTIDYLYRPIFDASDEEEASILSKKITAAQADPIYRYGKQQMRLLDPRSQTEDLGDNAVKASEYGISNLKYILPHVNEWVKDDADYTYRSDIYEGIVMQYLNYIRHVYAYIGGMYLNEKLDGDPIDAAYCCVPREIQKEAFDFLCSQVRDLKWLDREDIMKEIQISGNPSKALELAIAQAIVSAPAKVMTCDIMMKDSEDTYTYSECLKDVYDFVWESAKSGKELTDLDRMLQREFVSVAFKSAGFSYNGASATPKQRAIATVETPDFLADYEARCLRATRDVDETSLSYNDPMVIFATQPVVDADYYAYIKKVEKLVSKRASSAKGEDKAHYELLERNIKNALKK